jgi:hypothetical protein
MVAYESMGTSSAYWIESREGRCYGYIGGGRDHPPLFHRPQFAETLGVKALLGNR